MVLENENLRFWAGLSLRSFGRVVLWATGSSRVPESRVWRYGFEIVFATGTYGKHIELTRRGAGRKIAEMCTWTRSSVVEKVLLLAHEEGKSFSVYVVDSRPMLEGSVWYFPSTLQS